MVCFSIPLVQIPTALNLQDITSKFLTVVLLVIVNIQRNFSPRICRYIYDLSSYVLSCNGSLLTAIKPKDKYILYDSRQGVVLQLGGWAWG